MRKFIPLFVTVLLACCKSAGPCPQISSTPCIPDATPAPVPVPVVVDASPPAPPPPPAPDAGSLVHNCGAAQANLLKLGCKDSRGRLIGGPNLHGATWASMCVNNTLAEASMNPVCVAAAQDCPTALACH